MAIQFETAGKEVADNLEAQLVAFAPALSAIALEKIPDHEKFPSTIAALTELAISPSTPFLAKAIHAFIGEGLALIGEKHPELAPVVAAAESTKTS